MEELITTLLSSGSTKSIVVGLFVWFVSKHGDDLIKIARGLFVKKEKIELQHHFFLRMLDNYIKYEIDSMTFHNTNKARNKITAMFVKTKMKHYKKKFEDLINDESVYAIGPSKLKDMLLEIMITTRKEYDDDALSQGVPQVFIDKYNERRKDLASQCFKRVEDYCMTSLFPTNHITLMRVFDMLVFVFQSVITDAEQSIARMNGELDEVIFEGEKIGKGTKTNFLYGNVKNEH